MMRRYSLLFVLLLALPAQAQEPPPSVIRQFDIPTLEKLGRDIYAQDQAAWHATDALSARLSREEFQREKIRGWIIVDRPEGPLVRFIRDGEAGPQAAYDITDPHGRPVVSVPADRTLTDKEKALFAARSHAIASVQRDCAENYNTVVLKDPEGDGWLVWALASTTNPDLVVTLGHIRLTVSADGSKVLRTDRLSLSCGAMSGKGEDGKMAEAIVITQLVAPLPVETYVFLSLQHPLPFLVVTAKNTAWMVSRGKISKYDMAEPSKP
jgi:hypothetical protein